MQYIFSARSSISQMTSARGLHISAETDKDEFMSQEQGTSMRKFEEMNACKQIGWERNAEKSRAQPSGDGHVQPGL